MTRIKIGPRFLGACSLAASEAEVEDAGYSPKKRLISREKKNSSRDRILEMMGSINPNCSPNLLVLNV